MRVTGWVYLLTFIRFRMISGVPYRSKRLSKCFPAATKNGSATVTAIQKLCHDNRSLILRGHSSLKLLTVNWWLGSNSSSFLRPIDRNASSILFYC
jgi:hypothetical protein